MKILLFTHKSDIDGMGGAILANLAFEDVTYVLCEAWNVDQEFNKYYNELIYAYDFVFVTDLCLNVKTLEKIALDKKMVNKFKLFDHHTSALENIEFNMDFITLKVEDEKGLCCGTSLFYEYLTYNKLLNQSASILQFVELVRRYDTWEWKTKYNDENARKLTLLFDIVGNKSFINIMTVKLKNNQKEFSFNEYENMMIDNKIIQINNKLENYVNSMEVVIINNLKVGIIFNDYEYRNDISQLIRDKKINIDYVMLVSFDRGTVSLRSIKSDINVRVIAKNKGGNGHDYAASFPINSLARKRVMEIIANI